MDKLTMLSHVYRIPKNHPHNVTVFPNDAHKNISKKPLTNIKSINSTRDQSLNRSTTPSKIMENLKRKSTNLPKLEDDTIESMKKKLDEIFQALPRVPKKPTRTQQGTSKKINISFEGIKTESRPFEPQVSNRSRSTIATKKSVLPKIHKENCEMSDLQKYMIEFHQKSKFLLSQLEERVLGKDHN